jgi:hypothetical protein
MNGTELLHYMIEHNWPGVCVKLKLTRRGDYLQTSQGILTTVKVHLNTDVVIASNKKHLILYLLELEGSPPEYDSDSEQSDDPDLVVINSEHPHHLAAELSSVSTRFGLCTLSVYDHMLSYCSFLCAIHRATPLLKINCKYQPSIRAFQTSLETFVPCYSKDCSQQILVGHTMSHFQNQVITALGNNTIQLTDIQLVELMGPDGTIITSLTELWPLLDLCVDSRTMRLHDTLLPKVSGMQIVFRHDSAHATNTKHYDAHWCNPDPTHTELTLHLTENKDQHKWQGTITRLPELRVLFHSFYQKVVHYTDWTCGPIVPCFRELEVVQPLRIKPITIGEEIESWETVNTRDREISNQATQHSLICNTESVSGLFYVVSDTFIAVKVQCLYPYCKYIPTMCQIPTITHLKILQYIPSPPTHTAANGWDWVVLSFTTLPFLLGNWQEMEHWAIRFCWHITHVS